MFNPNPEYAYGDRYRHIVDVIIQEEDKETFTDPTVNETNEGQASI